MKYIAKKCVAIALVMMMVGSSVAPSVFAESNVSGNREEAIETIDNNLKSDPNKEIIDEDSSNELNSSIEESNMTSESRLDADYSKQDSGVKYLYGSNRFKTAVKVSQEGWPSGSDNVVIVNSKNTITGIIATPLATAHNAPILMTEQNNLIGDISNELKRLKPKNIYIVGDRSIISKEVSDKMKAATGANIVRIFGKYPGEISAAVAQNIAKVKKVDTAYVVSVTNGVADALTISSKAGETKNPVIVVDQNYINANAFTFLSTNVSSVYYVGGEKSISTSLINQIDGVVNNAGAGNRVYGSSRHSTNVNVVNRFYKDVNLPAVTVTKSDNIGLVDTVPAGPLAAKKNSPIVLTEKNSVPNVTKELLDSRKTNSIYQIGGGISASVTNTIKTKLSEDTKPLPEKPDPDQETEKPTTPPDNGNNNNENPGVVNAIKGKKIVIDAGHGGSDSGAIGLYGVREKDWTLKTAKACADYLTKAGAIVIMTRTTDVYPTLQDRANLSNNKNAAFFCSIHYNKGGNVINSATGELSGTGVEVFKGEGAYANRASQNVLNSILQGFNLRNRGTKDGTQLYVVRNTSAPAILVEGGFLSNSKDVSLLNNDAGLKKMGEQIAKGIISTFEGK